MAEGFLINPSAAEDGRPRSFSIVFVVFVVVSATGCACAAAYVGGSSVVAISEVLYIPAVCN